MNVLIACEFSGIVREAFRARGHNAWSCDLLPTEIQGNHHTGDVLEFIQATPYLFDPLITWDLMIAHPPCTYLCNSGVRWLYRGGAGIVVNEERWTEMEKAAAFFNTLLNQKIYRIAIENPVMHSHANIRKPDFSIQPWQFGEPEIKRTCFWTRNLPDLVPTQITAGRIPRVHHASPGPERWKERSRTLRGIANAMADQWGSL